MPKTSLSFAEDMRLHYDPEAPEARFAAATNRSERLPIALHWPTRTAPQGRPLATAPKETDSLERFEGYDAVVMTYTSAEAAALASLLTPHYPVSDWYEYRNNLSEFIPIVTGKRAPFNSTDKLDARYYHSLGLYFPCSIGKARVLLIKSGLHLDYDQEKPKPGDVVPYQKMLSLVLDTIKPQIFITTGTGGGVGAQVALGDVVLASQTRFHCTSQFAGMSWRSASYATTPVTASALALITPALTKVNAARVAAATPIKGRATPTIWSGAKATIVTTDLFAFDTSDNKPFGLQGLGQVCDMGDAMAGQTLSNYKNIHWYAIRNASDPQIPDEGGITYEQADHEAGTIYRDYGPYTTAASVIASWAIIADAVG